MDANELRALADALERIVPHIEDILHSAPDDLERAADYLRARAEAHPAPAVPAGWKRVPVEPTGLMVDAGREAMQHAPDLGGIVSANTAEVMDSYTAMLAAAPAAPQTDEVDLDAVAMQQMRQAAAESTWMPSGYTSNDWIADVCRWLRDGPPVAAPQAEPIDPHMIVAEDRFPDEQAEPKRDWTSVDAAIREYLDDYELIVEDDAGADAYYTPTERELYLIYDSINGLLADESFVAAISVPQAQPKREPTCLWSRADDDTDVWETSCRHAFTIIEGGPTDNQMAFCCYCGRPVDEEIGGSDDE